LFCGFTFVCHIPVHFARSMPVGVLFIFLCAFRWHRRNFPFIKTPIDTFGSIFFRFILLTRHSHLHNSPLSGAKEDPPGSALSMPDLKGMF